MTRTYEYARRNRRAAVMAAALVAFAVAASILFAVLQSAVNHQRQIRDELHRTQGQWLANAGIERAVAELRRSPAYRAETWRVEANEFDGDGTAEVRIQIDPVADRAEELHIAVTAEYPSGSVHRAQISRDVVLHLK